MTHGALDNSCSITYCANYVRNSSQYIAQLASTVAQQDSMGQLPRLHSRAMRKSEREGDC